MSAAHQFDVVVTWSGNRGTGTENYRAYGRDHTISSPGADGAVVPPPIPGSSDPAFRGDADRWNPEQLLVASLSQCHMLWYLHLAATNGVVVVGYRDAASGTMAVHRDGSGEFESVTLRPTVTVANAEMAETARSLHGQVPALCFIARSVNFPVHHEPEIVVADQG